MQPETPYRQYLATHQCYLNNHETAPPAAPPVAPLPARAAPPSKPPDPKPQVAAQVAADAVPEPTNGPKSTDVTKGDARAFVTKW